MRYAEPDYLLNRLSTSGGSPPNDPNFPQQWELQNTGQLVNGSYGTPGDDIDVVPVWSSVTTGSASVVIGLVDDSFDYTDTDLAGNAWNNPGGIGGCPVGTHGYDAAAGTCNPSSTGSSSAAGHGTIMAHILGSVGNNSLDKTGVNWTTAIMGVSTDGNTDFATTITALAWVVQARQAGVNVRVINASWGWYNGYSQAMADEISTAGANGILLVAGAGNGQPTGLLGTGGMVGVNTDTTPFYPCDYGGQNVICVAAVDQNFNLHSWSNYGPNTVDLAAPALSGTSESTAYVSGAAALLATAHPEWTMGQLRAALVDDVRPVASLSGKVRSGGVLDVSCAMSLCRPPSPSPSPTPTPAPSPGSTPTPSPTPTPTASPTATPGPTPAASLTPAASPTPTRTASPAAIAGPTPGPSPIPGPSAVPSDGTAPTVWLGSSPAGLSRSRSASVTFSATDPDDPAADLSSSCSVDGAASGCSSPLVLSDLADGPHTLTVQARDPAGNTSNIITASWTVDTTPPTAVLRPLAPFRLASSIPLSWTGTDQGSGISSYDLRYQRASSTTGFSSWSYPPSWQHTTAQRTTLAGLPAGFDYCVAVRAHDRAGNTSRWSSPRCTARPLDDRALTARTGWVRGSGPGYYASTYTATTRLGATLTRGGALIDRVGLLATTCPRCGTIGIYLNGRPLRTISLNSRTTHRQVLLTLPTFSYRRATITLKVLTHGKPVIIDALALSRT